MKGLLVGAGLLAGVVVAGLAALAVVTYASHTIHVRPALVAGNVATAQYAAGIASVGFTMDVRSTERHPQVAGLPDSPGLQDVRLQVGFTNTSPAQQRADPGDFSLQDATGAVRRPITGGDACPAWPKTDLHAAANDGQPPRDAGSPQTGPSFDPVPLCFAVAGDPDGQLLLHWDPDVSVAFLSSPVEVLLPPAP
jgi:hypothetical protein